MTESDTNADRMTNVSDHSRFFDWASTSPMCYRARKKRDEYLLLQDTACDAPLSLEVSTLGLAELRSAIASAFGASLPYEVILGRSVSEFVTLLAYGLADDPHRQKVVVTDLDHAAAIMPWLGPAGHRWDVVAAPSNDDGTVDTDAMAQLIDERTAVVVCTHLSHIHGTTQPVGRVAGLAAASGAVRQACQSVTK